MKDGKGVDHIAGGCPEKPGGPEHVRQSRLPVRWEGWGTERGGGGDLVPCLDIASFITDAILLSMGASA
jgi:hypothetical protein